MSLRKPALWTVVLLLLSVTAILGGNMLEPFKPAAPIGGWMIGLLFMFAAAFAASKVFSGTDDE
ncbi:hypothetical protein [uncultured Paenibacillus sp.]|uniref:hypothetical protein n=1 Tax=uncultured Paenibacillus sp. TaxID=227322 RepID=UPI0028D05984|nr:hypothetical protein [uncultured Paenibacillus sp.]